MMPVVRPYYWSHNEGYIIALGYEGYLIALMKAIL